MEPSVQRPIDTLAAALEREHNAIDRGIEEFLAALERGQGETDALRQAMAALRRHIFLEEEFVFPPLRDAGLVAPIFVMLREHGEIWDTLDRLDAHLVNDPNGGPAGEACRELLARLDRHNAKEEAIVYPEADAVLSTTADAGLRAFLAAGHMPQGWVCGKAGG